MVWDKWYVGDDSWQLVVLDNQFKCGFGCGLCGWNIVYGNGCIDGWGEVFGSYDVDYIVVWQCNFSVFMGWCFVIQLQFYVDFCWFFG